jgi:Na+/proline symporter
MVQRLLAARSERESKLAIVSSGVIVFLQFALFLLLGVLLFTYHQYDPLIPPGGDRDRIFPEFVVRAMPVGIVGLLLAAIFAAAMSNLSGALNSLASSSIIDFWRPGHRPGDHVTRSRWVTVGWGIVLMALGTLEWGEVLEKGLTIASIILQSLLGLFLLGILNKHATARGALAGMFAGLALMFYVWGFTKLAWTWYVLVGTVATFAVGSAVSLLDKNWRPPMNAGNG